MVKQQSSATFVHFSIHDAFNASLQLTLSRYAIKSRDTSRISFELNWRDFCMYVVSAANMLAEQR